MTRSRDVREPRVLERGQRAALREQGDPRVRGPAELRPGGGDPPFATEQLLQRTSGTLDGPQLTVNGVPRCRMPCRTSTDLFNDCLVPNPAADKCPLPFSSLRNFWQCRVSRFCGRPERFLAGADGRGYRA